MVFTHPSPVSPSLVSIEYAPEVAVALIHHEGQGPQRVSRKLCRDLLSSLKAIDGNDEIQAGILCADDGHFPTGLDLDDLETSELGAYLKEVTDCIAASNTLWIAALQGPIRNAGLELALACDMRIAMEGANFGFSDGAIQLLPCSGAAARLVRLTRGETALGLLLGEQTLSADAAQAEGLIDVSVSGSLQVEAVTFAQEALHQAAKRPTSKHSHGTTPRGWHAPSTAKRRLTELRTSSNPTHSHIAHIMEMAMATSRNSTLTAEWDSFETLLNDGHARIPRHLRKAAERWQCARAPASLLPLRSVHLVSDQADDRVATTAATLFRAKLITACRSSEGRDLTKDCLRLLLEHDRITPQEAAEWRVQLQQQKPLTPDLIFDLRTDTSLESISSLEATLPQTTVLVGCSHMNYGTTHSKTFKHRERCLSMPLLGLAPFSKLVEIVRFTNPPSASAQEPYNTPFALTHELANLLGVTCLERSLNAEALGWTLLSTCLEAASALLLEGAMPQDIDSAMVNYGFAYGIFELDDEIGFDENSKQQDHWGANHEAISHRDMIVRDALCKANRFGRKVGKGWYDYPRDTQFPSPEVANIIRSLAPQKALQDQRHFSPGMIMSQLLLSMQQTARNILNQRRESGQPVESACLDLVLIEGFGFPPRHGGPIFMPEEDMSQDDLSEDDLSEDDLSEDDI